MRAQKIPGTGTDWEEWDEEEEEFGLDAWVVWGTLFSSFDKMDCVMSSCQEKPAQTHTAIKESHRSWEWKCNLRGKKEKHAVKCSVKVLELWMKFSLIVLLSGNMFKIVQDCNSCQQSCPRSHLRGHYLYLLNHLTKYPLKSLGTVGGVWKLILLLLQATKPTLSG